jgi:hypothetical protein
MTNQPPVDLQGKVLTTIMIMDLERKKTIDISRLMSSYVFYENMVQGGISANVMITDSIGLLEKFPVTGNELVKISFRHLHKGILPHDIEISQEFRLIQINGFTPGQNENQYQMYQMVLMSVDAFTNTTNMISKYVRGKAGSVVEGILKNDIKTTKSILQTSDCPVQFSFPYLHPFDAIRLIASKTFSGDDQDAFVFWEDRDQFAFESLRILERQNTTFQYIYRDGKLAALSEGQGKYIKAYKIERGYDFASNITTGVYHGDTTLHDLVTNNITTKTFTFNDLYAKQYDDLGLTAKTDLDQIGGWRRIASDNRDRLNASYINDRGNVYPWKVNPSERYGFLKSHAAVEISFVVTGDTKLKPGYTANMGFRSFANDEKTNESKYLSGKYMITAVKHTITGTNEQNYECHCRAYKIPSSR